MSNLFQVVEAHEADPGSLDHFVPPSMQPFTPTPFEIPEIPGMTLVYDRPLLGGRQARVRMRNGWEVSVVNHWGAYGGLEVGFFAPDGEMTAPPFHDDMVMGYLDEIGLIKVITAVHNIKESDVNDPTPEPGRDPGQAES